MSHARLSPSAAARWMACPGSVRLIEGVAEGVLGPASEAAEEGTHAHAALEYAIKSGIDPMQLVDTPFYDRNLEAHTAEAIKVAFDYVQGAVAAGATVLTERRVTPGQLFREDINGTADIILQHPSGMPEIVDYKHGKGVLVEVKGNRQLQIYLLGVMHEMNYDPDKGGFATIIQPRCPHPDGPIRVVQYLGDEVYQFTQEIAAAAAATDDPAAPCVPGEAQCQWCPVRPCEAAATWAVQQTRQVFDDLTLLGNITAAETELHTVQAGALSPEMKARMLQVEPLVTGLFKSLRESAIEDLKEGREIPGYHLVAGRKSRNWDQDQEAMLKFLAGRKKLDGKKVTLAGASKATVLSPAQAEKQLKPLVSEATWKNVSKHIAVGEGKPVLAPVTDSRAPIKDKAEDVFGVISPASAEAPAFNLF